MQKLQQNYFLWIEPAATSPCKFNTKRMLKTNNIIQLGFKFCVKLRIL